MLEYRDSCGGILPIKLHISQLAEATMFGASVVGLAQRWLTDVKYGLSHIDIQVSILRPQCELGVNLIIWGRRGG
jgi:hypothetical protein